MGVPIRHPADQIRPRYGFGDVVALSQIAPGCAHEVPVGLVLHSLGHGLHAQPSRHAEARLEDGPEGRIPAGAVHEAPIHLELAEGKVAQLGERRVTGAEVVNGQADALEAQAREDVQRPSESFISRLSVTSSTRLVRGTPALPTSRATKSGNSSAARLSMETFTATCRERPASCQRPAWRRAPVSTARVSWSMRVLPPWR
jgi:hypothetical protein